ncbi:ATP-binding protein [Thiohalorhabdus sp. Cl-TMA]|uniref:histidine kinase n=1 Tax=Thiohalorhabdus methylotrophus TaxID=3242694 RepID=A0ABV4TXX3_9GAMM
MSARTLSDSESPSFPEDLDSRAWLHSRELKARLTQQEAIAELGERGLRGASLQALFDRATQALYDFLDVDLAKVLEWHPDQERLLLKSGVGWQEGRVGLATEPDGRGSPGGYTLLADSPVHIADLASETRFSPSELLRDHAAVSGITVVIRGVQRAYGVLAAFSRKRREFSRSDVHFLQALANVLAGSIQRASTEAELRRSETTFRETFTHAGVGITIMDLDGRILEANPAYGRIVGYPPEELVKGRYSIQQLTHAEDLDKTEDALARLRAEEEPAHALEKRLLRKDGSAVWVQVTDTVLPDTQGRTKRLIGINEDITQRHAAEEALVEADRRRDVFLSMLGHELRNPLTPIATMAHFLEQSAGRVSPDRLTRAAATISRQSAHLSRIVEDLLDLNRIKTGRIVLHEKPLDLRDAARQAVESVSAIQEKKRQILEVDLPEVPLGTRGDPVRLTQVLSNLLDNAVKYTPEGGTIRLAGARQADQLLLTVSDTGQGIAREHLPHLFELFERAHPAQTSAQGLGLGLSLVRSLVEMHGGRVEASSPGAGQGSEFRVRLPAADLEERSGADSTPPASGEDRLVLLVEDNEDVAASLGFLLEGLGYRWRHAETGERAFELVRSTRPVLALIDIGLPDHSGFEVASRLREVLDGALLVALSGYPPSQFNEEATELFDAYLVKPPTLENLQQVLARIGPA